jgi:hypothetical protein
MYITSWQRNTMRIFHQPILSAFIKDRVLGRGVIGAVAIHFGLNVIGLPGFECPIRAATGVPCPGCGLSRASIAMVKGDWQTMTQYHLFAPLFAIALLIITTGLLLPVNAHGKLVAGVSNFETNTAVSSVLLAIFMIYWIWRLANGLIP